MESPAIRTVEQAQEARAVALQVLAFAADPATRWLYPDPDEYLTHFPRFVRAFGGRAFESGTAFVQDAFGGGAFWYPAGVHPDGDALELLVRETVRKTAHDEVFAVLEKMGEFHTQEPHWYLAILGVQPSRQGEGIGSALLRHTLEVCDREGLIAYLESSNPKNVPLYRRHGFDVIGEIQVGNSPPIYPMLRGSAGVSRSR
jgi:GNAT superfamily N-acetyltransferase